MKKIFLSIITAGLILFTTGCEDYLDINTNPNGPTSVSPFLYLSPMEAQNAEAIGYDSRMFAYYTQNIAYYTADYRYDQQGDPAWTSDMAQYWRCYYWRMGQNLIDMINLSKAQERWDLVGIGYSLQAWTLQQLIDEHGPVVIKQAFTPGLKIFDYDTEEFGYHAVDSLCQMALRYLKRTDGAVSETYAAKGDMVYKGVRSKWIKFTYATLTLNKSHLSNKSIYDAALVMKYVDSSFTSNADNYYVPCAGTSTTDANFVGPMRDNFRYAVPGQYAVSLLNGSVFPVSDPRISIMLPASDNIKNGVPGAQYVGLFNGKALTTIADADRPYNLFGVKDRTAAAPVGTAGNYIFKDAVDWPMITYSELQFIKAEAAFRANDKATALTAYSNGVSSAIDFTGKYVGKTTWGTTTVAVSAADKATYLNAVVPTDANNLTMSNIMCQKYIHLWGWGTLETWMDMRRFHYTDTWDTETTQVYASFTLPTLYSTNEGKTVQRIRPRYNSEYVWNYDAIVKIGADKSTYHTKELWAITTE
jgi:hypothetical protein